jgi:signal transduction histidine kinase
VTIRVGDLEDGSGFYVADGVGIPASDRERIFEPGYTTDDDGTGFGPNVVDRIVEAHDWDLAVTESAEGGARVEVGGVEVSGVETER